MFIIEGLQTYFQSLWGEVVNISLDNPLSYVYAILNVILMLFGLQVSD